MFAKQTDLSALSFCHLSWRSVAVRTAFNFVTDSMDSPYDGSLSDNPPERTESQGGGGLHTPSPAWCPSPSRCSAPCRSNGTNVLPSVRTETHADCFGMAQGGKPCAKLQFFRQRFLSGPRPRTARYAQVATLHQNRIPTARP
jgi:hypothetical protein